MRQGYWWKRGTAARQPMPAPTPRAPPHAPIPSNPSPPAAYSPWRCPARCSIPGAAPTPPPPRAGSRARRRSGGGGWRWRTARRSPRSGSCMVRRDMTRDTEVDHPYNNTNMGFSWPDPNDAIPGQGAQGSARCKGERRRGQVPACCCATWHPLGLTARMRRDACHVYQLN